MNDVDRDINAAAQYHRERTEGPQHHWLFCVTCGEGHETIDPVTYTIGADDPHAGHRVAVVGPCNALRAAELWERHLQIFGLQRSLNAS